MEVRWLREERMKWWRKERTRMYLHLVQLGLGLLFPPQWKNRHIHLFFVPADGWMLESWVEEEIQEEEEKEEKEREQHGRLERLQLIETKPNSKEEKERLRSNKERVCLSGSHSCSVPEVCTLTLASTLTREQGSPVCIPAMREKRKPRKNV